MALNEIKDKIWIGSLISTSSEQTFKRENITHILSVLDLRSVGYNAKTFSEKLQQLNLQHLYLDLQDTEEEPILKVFKETNAFIDDAVMKNEGILVHCIAGISRSVTVTCAYLMWKHKWTDLQAIEFVQSKRKVANPNDSFREQLKVYYQCGYEISDEKKPYREWLFKSQASDIHSGIQPSLSYTNTEMPALKLTWRHIVPKLTELPVAHIIVDGKPVGLTERVNEDALKGIVELISDNEPILVSTEHLRQVIDKLAIQKVVLRCKNCSNTIASSGSFVVHTPGKEGPCGHYFLEPVEWMRPELEKSELEGKLACPHCSHKLGAYAWQGSKCSCGSWITPSIRLQKGRVDCMTAKQKPSL